MSSTLRQPFGVAVGYTQASSVMPVVKSREAESLTVTQSFLRASPYRVVRIDPAPNGGDRMIVTVDLDRKDPSGVTCVRQVPFTAVKTAKYGWIVSSIDLNLAGAPGRPCSTKAP
mgnify:CR=1 FL=1